MPVKFVETKWRPPLWAIVIVSLLIVTLLPMVGLAFILLAENMLDLRFTLRSLQGGALLAVACISTALLVGFVLVRTLVRPLQALEARARNIDAGGAITRDLFQHAGTREMARLAELDIINLNHSIVVGLHILELSYVRPCIGFLQHASVKPEHSF